LKKIDGVTYLNRAEAIGYLLHAYKVKWCMTRWSGQIVIISLESSDGSRLRKKVPAFKAKGSRIVRVCKEDLDGFFEST
jgi:hypothetical protein